MRLLPAVVVCCSLALSSLPTAAAASGPDYEPGAPGIGDDYFPLDGNGGYDVQHYDLAVGYTPETDVLTGTATITARATQDLSQFDLDLDGLEVASVTVDRRAATWTRDDGELVITPRRGLRERHRFTVVVTYSGVPETIDDEFGLSGFFHTDDGALVVGEPQVAATWFPANDHPSDKASYQVEITVPAGLQTISNGDLRRTRTRAGLTTTTWASREPMASYLVMMAIGHFDVREYEAGGVSYLDAVDPDLYAAAPDGSPSVGAVADEAFARQPEIVDFLASRFGPYPFRDGGGVVDDEERYQFALENQTRPTYATGFFTDSEGAASVVVHEIAHQWFGDSVAVRGWKDIWLNEGFAQYAEFLWSEEEGLGTAQEAFDELYAIPADDEFWTLPPADPGTSGIFDDPVYYRGAMTLHALRLAVGDDTFFSILQQWAAGKEGGNGTTSEFTALAEQVSGQDLGGLFTAWLLTPTKPAL